MARRQGAVFALLVVVAAGCGGDDVAAAAFPGANVVILSLDTCRRDALSLYGGPTGISPALDRFAEQAVVFEHARAQAPHTAPSHMSLFTSTYPSVHGVQNVQHATDPVSGASRPLIEALPTQIPTLAEILSAADYRAIGITDGGNLNAAHGFPRGFEHYSLELSGAEEQVRRGLRWIHRLAGEEHPYFLFWHTYEIHAPYVSPAEYLTPRWVPARYDGLLAGRIDQIADLDFKGRFGAMRDVFWRDKERFGWPESAYLHGLYRAGVHYTDDVFSRLLDAFEARGVFDDSIVIVLSDHGEEFFEHGQWQHDQLYEECLRVPLMIRLPGGVGAGRRIHTPVALLDVMPTVLELTGVEPEALALGARVRMQGRSLAQALLEGVEPAARPIYSEVRTDREGGPLYDWQVAVHHEDMKLIVDQYRGAPGKPRDWRPRSLYDLAADASEQKDLAPDEPPALAALFAFYSAYLRDLEAWDDLKRLDAGADLDEAALQELRELGYLK